MEQITQEELNERIAILKKFKQLLEKQREKFREYLNVLEKQESSITNEDSEKLLAHTELEQQVVANIMNLQKVIVPMSELYKSKGADIDDSAVKEIQQDLKDLQQKVLAQNAKNRESLKTHISQIRTQIASLKNPYKNARSVYSEKAPVGNLVAIEA